MTFPTPLIFIIKETKTMNKLTIPSKGEYKSSENYLKRLIQILSLPYT